ncbi:MAG: 30S ribosomal protein S6 [Candidatus Adiutrix sp.]|nr:30S ribosomal protein S6 [Candidatus Adiutrix sp.]
MNPGAILAPPWRRGLNAHEEEDMHPRRYETLILLAPNLEAQELETFKTKVDNIMATGGGQLVRLEDWGRRRLAYPVKKEMFGYYLLYDFQGRPALATELERNLKIDEKVFKYLTLVLDKKFTDDDLVAAKEKLLAEAARREAEKAKAQEAVEERLNRSADDRDDDENVDDDRNDRNDRDDRDDRDDDE